MALVKCKECDRDVSDAAAACPNCGAPVPKTIDADEEQCPFCMTVVRAEATVCPNCKAKKGYTQAQGTVYGKGLTIFWGIIVPALIAIFAFSFGTTFGNLVGLVLLIPVGLSGWRLKSGPVWYQSRSVHN